MATFAVTYSYDDSTTVERDRRRAAHAEYLYSQFSSGRLVTSGPFDDSGTPGALLIMRGEDAEAVAKLLNGDPFHAHGLIAERTIRKWDIVFGG